MFLHSKYCSLDYISASTVSMCYAVWHTRVYGPNTRVYGFFCTLFELPNLSWCQRTSRYLNQFTIFFFSTGRFYIERLIPKHFFSTVITQTRKHHNLTVDTILRSSFFCLILFCFFSRFRMEYNLTLSLSLEFPIEFRTLFKYIRIIR